MGPPGLKASLVIVLAVLFVAGEHRLVADDRANPPFRVRGRLIDEGDQPVANAEVVAIHDEDKATTRTDDVGNFVLDLVRKPGLVFLLANDSSGRQACGVCLLDERARHALDRFVPNVEARLPENVTLVARPARKIEAVVVDGDKQPVADAKMLLQGTWYHTIAATKTDADGKAALFVPADAPRSSVVVLKPGVGLDYFLYENPQARDEYHLASDHAEPLTFVLNGRRKVTVKVVDEDGHAVADAKVSPWCVEKPRKGEIRPNGNLFDMAALYTDGLADFSVASDAEGLATFDFVPADNARALSFQGSARDRMMFQNAHVPLGSGDAEATLTMFRVMPLDVHLAFSDGRPAAGAALYVFQEALDDGRDSGPHGSRSFTAFADEEGHLRANVFPNHFLLLMASTKEWAAPLTTCVARNEAPEKPLEIILQKATRVHGRLTIGPDNCQMSKQLIGNFQHVDDAYRELRGRGLALKADTRPRPAAKANDVKLLSHQSTTTDAAGEFEFFLGPGKHQLRYGNETVIDFELNGEADHEVNLHADRATGVEFVGRVVFQEDEKKDVAHARITAYFLGDKRRYASIETTANASGVLRFYRPPGDMLLYVRDEKGLSAQVISVAADDKTVIVRLRPAASAHGRLLDATTGEPVPNARVAYGIFPWDGPTTLSECGGSVQTDERGEFTAVGLVPGQRYRFTLFQNGPQDQIATTAPAAAEEIELGVYRVDLTGKAHRRATGPVASKGARQIFQFKTDANSRLAAAQKQAKDEKKRVLLVLGADWSAWCQRLDTLFRDDDEIAKLLRDNFVVVLVDADDARKEGGNSDVIKRHGTADSRLPMLVALDVDGRHIDLETSPNIEDGDHFDTAKVLAFLNSSKAPANTPKRRRTSRAPAP